MHSANVYRERLLPSPVTTLVFLLLLLVFAVAVGAPLPDLVGWLVFFVGGAVVGAFVFWSAPVVCVTSEMLQVGSARLPRTSIASAEALDAHQARAARGQGSDARTFVMLVTWATGKAVHVTLDDPADPHPAWLFSSRHPDRVVRALQ